jgi:dynein heavy chain 2
MFALQILLYTRYLLLHPCCVGVKKNLQRIYEGWTPEFISNGSILRSQALFALAWFHAIVQERRNYIPQGWNKFYEFSAADLRSTAELLSRICQDSQSNGVQWPIVHGLIENAIYGGRIDDIYDDLKLKSYLNLFFSDGNQIPFYDRYRWLKILLLPDKHRHFQHCG